ncbi:MAG: alanine racemase [Lachnospiraceae bacterium]
MKKYNRVYADIDLDAVTFNYEQMHQNLSDHTKMIAVIKTDAYGHGAVPIAKHIEKLDYLWGFATATVDEAAELRMAGIQKPILVLGYSFPESYETIVKYDIRQTVFSMEAAEGLSEEAVRQQKDVVFHVKLDTGMGRIGYQTAEEALTDLKKISKLPNVVLEGIFTHFAAADSADKTYTNAQIQKYQEIVDVLSDAGIHFQLHHCSNSAGIIDLAQIKTELVRAGIISYGLWPSDEVTKDRVLLKPVLSLKSHVVYVKDVKPGTAISYGGTWIAKRTSRIATVPVGYGDGYPRSLSNKGYVIIHGKKAPIVGRVCMDQFMIDVTEVPETKAGDEVILLGTDGTLSITAEELGDLSGRFNYELVCDLGNRIPRIYRRKGEITEVRDYFEK